VRSDKQLVLHHDEGSERAIHAEGSSSWILRWDHDLQNSGRDERRTKASWKCRGKGDEYRDLCHLDRTTPAPIVFVGGKSYLPLFCRLTAGIADRTIMYNSGVPPIAPGCKLARFVGKRRMNWQYDCAEWLLANELSDEGAEA
jgi:hypothetical protein